MTAPLLRMTGITKSFPGVRALSGVDLEVKAGEVLALLGENGAGKSTLIKILGGAHPPDSGSIELDGQAVVIREPGDAQKCGISIIYQEFNLVPDLSARENIFLGQEPSRFCFIPRRREHDKSLELFKRVGAKIDPAVLCRNLTVAQQQVVEIAKALAIDARVIVMDEPSAALSPREVDGLFRIIRELKSQNLAIIYISHRLSEIFDIADRVTVLRDGEHVGTKPIDELTRDSMIEMMVGRKLEDEFPKRTGDLPDHSIKDEQTEETGAAKIGPPRLVVRNLKRGDAVNDVSFDVRQGEIVALTGLVGAGRTETARLIFGADRRDSGMIQLDGKNPRVNSPRDAIAAGICLLTEDRKSQGLVLSQSLQENFSLPNLSRFSRFGFIGRQLERSAFDGYVKQLQIKIAGRYQRAATLSGGNQQKVVLAKWLERNAEMIIFDEPTRGIDVGAKYEIYLLMNRLVARGKAILMISSELPEVLGMADRILVMHEGRITGEITDVPSATQQQIMDLAVK